MSRSWSAALLVCATLCALASSACYRFGRVISEPTHVLHESFRAGPDLVEVHYDRDGDGPMPLMAYEVPPVEERDRTRPPRLLKNGVIRLEYVDPTREIRVRYFVRHAPTSEAGFQEVFSMVGTRKGRWPREVVFLEDVFPSSRNPFDLHVRDLANPHGGIRLGNGDLILIRVEDRITGDIQKAVFEYVDNGPQLSVWTNVLLSTGISFPLNPTTGTVKSEAYSFNLTLSLAAGWRPRKARGPIKWIGDNLALVLSIGVGALNTFDLGSLQDFNFELVAGGGIQLLDIVSLQILVNLTPTVTGSALSTGFLAVGFNVTEAARLGRRVVPRLFGKTKIRSY